MSMTNNDDDDYHIDIFSSITTLLPDGDGQDQIEIPLPTSPIAAAAHSQQQHCYYIHSIDSTVVIRQLPSQGLSFQLWPAATTLVTLLDRRHSHSAPPTSALSLPATLSARPLRILEIGSGTGLVGIAASAILGANVTVTDLPHVLPNLQFNADANSTVYAFHGGSVDVAPLSWGDADHMEAIGRDYDLILASDVVYHDHLYDPLLRTLRFFLLRDETEKKMVFVMAHLRRWKKESAFFKKARKLFNVEIIHRDNPSNGSRVGVVVYRFAGKCKCGQSMNTGGLANV